MRVIAAVLAAGNGTRFGGDKVRMRLGGKPVWKWSYDVFSKHPRIDGVVLVTNSENFESDKLIAENAFAVVLGGDTRKQSSLAALNAAGDADILLIHDGARPFLQDHAIDSCVNAISAVGAAATCIPVTDTVKQKIGDGLEHLPRESLVAMQTPQGATCAILREAHANIGDVTDDLAMIQSIGVPFDLVPGDEKTFKITTQVDFDRATSMLNQELEFRTGLGYDIHPFSTDVARDLWLGGVKFPDHPALDGHSDADVLLHAITDALLGAASLGDIGVHFPNTDARWAGASSRVFLSHAAILLRELGWTIVNIDASVIAETPKVMKQAAAIRKAIADEVNIDAERVSVKATTNEKLGSIGRSEGIAAFATATIKRL